MAQNKFQVSRYEMGEYKENKWYCGCGDLASNLISRKDQTRDDKCMSANALRKQLLIKKIVLRCPNTEDCGFFLWEKDESKARVSKSSPRTPQQNRTRTPVFLTPKSAHDSPGRRQALIIGSSLTSPTPKRVLDNAEMLDKPLLSEILELLKSANIEMKPSTDSQLQHLVNMKVETYEAKVRTCEATITDLRSKLVEMEI